MRRRIDLSLVLACRNLETSLEGNLRQILHTFSLSRFTYEMILIDDKSDDSTAQIIKSFKKSCRSKFPKITTIFHKKRLGRALTISEGIMKAKSPVVGTLSPGLGISPIYVTLATDTIITRQVDILVARRIFHPNSSVLVKFAYYLMAKLTDLFVDTSGIDAYSSFKFFNRKRILPLLSKVRHTGRLWDVELVIIAKRMGYRIGELPVVYRPKAEYLPITLIPGEVTGFLTDLLTFWQRMYLKARGNI
jgi:glycosyltransferase involved in cell wall biosynthesis